MGPKFCITTTPNNPSRFVYIPACCGEDLFINAILMQAGITNNSRQYVGMWADRLKREDVLAIYNFGPIPRFLMHIKKLELALQNLQN